MPVLLKALEAVVRGDRVESGGPLPGDPQLRTACGDATMRTRTPLNVAAPLVAGAILGRLAASVRLAAPIQAKDKPAASAELDRTVRQVFGLANQYMRWELDDLARR